MTLAADTSVGIIAGGGALPKIVFDHCKKQNLIPHIIRLKGHADDAQLNDAPGAVFKPEKLGHIFKYLRKNDIADIVMIGRVRRPSLHELRPDFKTVLLLSKIAPVMRKGGDDALLRTIRAVLEGEGFILHGVQDFVHDIAAPMGVMGQHQPSADQMNDIARGMDVARTIGGMDIGQSVVIQQGLVLGVEGVEGTDALVKRCAVLKREGPGPVLCKSIKPNQDTKMDLPTVGIDTIKNCVEFGFSGITVSADTTLMVELGDMITMADSNNLFIFGEA